MSAMQVFSVVASAAILVLAIMLWKKSRKYMGPVPEEKQDALDGIPVHIRGPVIDYGDHAEFVIPCPYCGEYGRARFGGGLYQVVTCPEKEGCGHTYMIKWLLHHNLYKLEEA